MIEVTPSLKMLHAFALMAKSTDVIRDTHGNLSCLAGPNLMFIKPSGVDYDRISDQLICAHDVATGEAYASNQAKSSVDTPYHLDIYQRHPWIRAICHTHSPYATAHAMVENIVPCVCTEHADYFGKNIRVVPYAGMEWSTGLTIEENERAVLLGCHGVLTFADDPLEAVKLAVAVENVCYKNFLAKQLSGRSLRGDQMYYPEAQAWHKRYAEKYGQR